MTRRYGEHRGLDNFSVAIPRGSVFGLLGPNGSGKSTFLSLIAAAEAPDSGAVRLYGREPDQEGRQRIGIVFQESTLDPTSTVADNLELSGRLFGLSRSECRTRAEELLQQFGLGDRYQQPITQLSGGMRRRVEVVRALLHSPDLLLLDEPTTGIDPGERQALWDALRTWPGEGKTVLLATNDLVEADGVCDYAAFIRDGRVVAAGRPQELKAGLQKEAIWLDWINPARDDLETVTTWPGVGSVSVQDTQVQITVDDASVVVPQLFALAPAAIKGVKIHPATLEDAYFHHVGIRAAEPRAEVTA